MTATQPTTSRILTNPKGGHLTTTFTDEQAAQICRQINQGEIGADKDRDFAGKLAEQFASRWGCSQAQRFWMHRIALNATMPQPAAPPTQGAAPATPQPEGAFPKVVEFLEPASKHLKSGACVVFQGTPVGPIQIKRCGIKSKFPGSFYVSDGGPYGQSKLYGRLSAPADGGKWYPTPMSRGGCPAEVVNILKRLGDNPRAFIRDYGVRTGRCCFCDLKLEEDASVQLGYGPVCAKHYGLPHGKKALKELGRLPAAKPELTTGVHDIEDI